MRIYIDSANIKDIEKVMNILPVDGVTTNPSLLAREKTNPMEQLKAIRGMLCKGQELHAQVISSLAEDMIIEAQHMREVLGEDIFIKVPVTPEGIKAMKKLSALGVNITATAIYTPMQAVIAAKAGAKWTAPYVNRLDMIGADGVQVAISIHNMLTRMPASSELLAASFKNVEQILKLAEAGAGAVTVAPDLLEQLLYHPLTDKAVWDFTADFESITAKGSTMREL